MSKSQDSLRRRLVTINQAADYLGCTDRHVRNLISRGDLRAYRVGDRMVRLDLADVDGLLHPIKAGGVL